MDKINSFEGIAEFVAVAESNGFSAAARHLGVSTSHVSRQVSALEARLATILLSRTTRQVKLTDAGTDYYVVCRELMDGLLQANESIQQQQVVLEGTLKISAAGEFAEQYIAPALIDFAEQHPNLNVDINFNTSMVNLVEEGIDFAIRYGRLTDSGLIARKLLERQLVAVASKDYLAMHGLPKHPQDLKQHSCLIANNDRWFFTEPSQAKEQATQAKIIDVKVSGRWRSNNVKALITACKANLGICYLPKSSYGDELKNQQLQPILTSYSSAPISTWIVYVNRRYLPARARLAIQFLLDHFSDWRE